MNETDKKRKEIETIDSMIASLLQQRMEAIQALGTEPVYTSQARKDYIIKNIAGSIDDKWYDYYYKLQKTLFDLTDLYQAQLADQRDAFLKDNADYSPFVDGVFAISAKANSDPDLAVNATIGSLYGEDGKLAVLPSVYTSYNNVDDRKKAKYAGGITGNDDFKECLYNWFNRNQTLKMPHQVVATPGGTGALSLILNNCTNPNETVLMPKVAWGSYKIMCQQFNLDYQTYEFVNADNEVDITDLMIKSIEIIKKQRKLILVINDPCQNPTGVRLGEENWQKLIIFFNKISEYGKIILINDVAYIDYAFDGGRNYLQYLNNLGKNILTAVTFSCSKTLTAYGMRLGAAILLGNDEEEINRVFNVLTKYARANWSNVNNGLMEAFVDVYQNHYDQFVSELQYYTDLLKQRSDAFVSQGKELGLPMYPYSEGFFVTLRIDDQDLLNKYHKYLMEQAHIYTIKVTNGIRIALCSLPVEKCQMLPPLLKQALLECQND